ncbi:tail protein X [uncultured Methylobacterium sp.]|jgi:phage tail protein X|uniref:tail protein X n=1 Tax=uncultured Methylobacterium sp. TaxID=157278 RepID=UPI00260A67C5|nr:tail protein X [uncultured Methylobacterium sp.]
MATYVTKTFDRLDKIVSARYGDTKNGIVEWVMEQNPGLERHGILLPAGITINLPDRPRNVSAIPVIQTIRLWN